MNPKKSTLTNRNLKRKKSNYYNKIEMLNKFNQNTVLIKLWYLGIFYIDIRKFNT